jgi:hypothetical protein
MNVIFTWNLTKLKKKLYVVLNHSEKKIIRTKRTRMPAKEAFYKYIKCLFFWYIFKIESHFSSFIMFYYMQCFSFVVGLTRRYIITGTISVHITNSSAQHTQKKHDDDVLDIPPAFIIFASTL